MTESKKETAAEDTDWADALDAWEEKAFGSIHPPPPMASNAPPPPEPEIEPGVPTPRPDGDDRDEGPDGTMASAAEGARPTPVPSGASVPDLDAFRVPDARGPAPSSPDVLIEEVDFEDDAVKAAPQVRLVRSAPPAKLDVLARSHIPAPLNPEIRFEPSPRISEPPVSVGTRALRSLASMESHHEELGRPSRMPMPSLRPVGADVAALLEEQAEWLEAESAPADERVRASVFLALSEIKAILGDYQGAHAFAEKSRDLVPEAVLAHWQARALAGAHPDVISDGAGNATTEAAALMAEESYALLPAAKQHAALLAADVLRFEGDAEGALLKLSRVADTADIRGVVGRAAFGLAHGDVDALSAFSATPEAKAVATGLASALRLRGVAAGSVGAATSPEGVSDALRDARLALEGGDTVTAASRIASIRAVPELERGASWLAATLSATRDEGRAQGMQWLGALASAGDPRASRVLAARAVESNDRGAATLAIELGGFGQADKIALSALLELEAENDFETLAPEMHALSAAVAAASAKSGPAEAKARAEHVVGTAASRTSTRVARLLASGAGSSDLEAPLAALKESSPDTAAALDLELALRDGAHLRVSDLLRGWGSSGESQRRVADAPLVAALLAERASDPARALVAYREARVLDRSSEVALRAVASLHEGADLSGELNELADELGKTVQAAFARLEAVIREDSVADTTRADLLERAYQAAPSVPLASYLSERIAVRAGNVEDIVRWIDDRRTVSTDTTELVMSDVREARLLSQRDPETSAARIAAAHRLRPNHLALRELYEKTLPTPSDDHAAYWETQAASTTGDSRALLYLEVAHGHERAGDTAGTLRVTEAAGAELPLVRLARERAELEGGEAATLIDRLLGEAKDTDDPIVRREAYERLADIDGIGRGDPASALLWHKSIIEEEPGHLPSLRYLEQALVREGRDEELEPIASSLAQALTHAGSTDGGERVAHADLAARLRARGPEGDWESTFELAELAANDGAPSLSSLRLLHAHARVRKDDTLLIKVSEQLLERATRPVEMAALRLRLAEAAFRQSDLATALTSLEISTAEDPGDLVAFRLLAEVRDASGDPSGAAEAHESVARLSLSPAHRLDAWYDAALLWLTDGEHMEEGIHALEQAAAINLAYEDVFSRLSALYVTKGNHSDLASLLERRIALATNADERVTLEVERGRALLASGDRESARVAVAAALAERPDHATALATFAELSTVEEDWPAAEDAWVRLARLLATPEEQREVYERLGDLYSTKAVHLERAELAFKEVLKRAPGDIRTLERLIDIHRRQRDVTRATEVQQELIALAQDPAEKRRRTIELAALHEDPGHDERRAEQILEGARREFPTDVVLLRALAEFYLRHKQTPAMNILLDRAAGDARRALAAGRFAPALFDIMRAVFELRGNNDAARIVGASLLAIEGSPVDVRGAFGPTRDPRIDDLLAPDGLSPGLRALLAQAGSMLDVAAPIDLRALAAQPAGPEARLIYETAASFAAGWGLAPPKIFVSKTLGRTCLPAASDPPALVVGEALLTADNQLAVGFIVMRAMKLLSVRGAALVRTNSTDLAALIPAWLQALVPSWVPQGVNPTALAAAARKVAQSAPPPMSEDLVTLGLEVASQLGTRASTLGGLALAWANRTALLGVGDPNAALDALAWSLGSKDGAPTDAVARAAWIGRTHEAKDLLIFSVGDAYAEARTRLDLRH